MTNLSLSDLMKLSGGMPSNPVAPYYGGIGQQHAPPDRSVVDLSGALFGAQKQPATPDVVPSNTRREQQMASLQQSLRDTAAAPMDISSMTMPGPSDAAQSIMSGSYKNNAPSPSSQSLMDEIMTHGSMMHGGLDPSGYAKTFASRSGLNLDDPAAMENAMARNDLPSRPYNAQSHDYGQAPAASMKVAGVTMPRGGPLRPDDQSDSLGHYLGAPSGTTPLPNSDPAIQKIMERRYKVPSDKSDEATKKSLKYGAEAQLKAQNQIKNSLPLRQAQAKRMFYQRHGVDPVAADMLTQPGGGDEGGFTPASYMKNTYLMGQPAAAAFMGMQNENQQKALDRASHEKIAGMTAKDPSQRTAEQLKSTDVADNAVGQKTAGIDDVAMAKIKAQQDPNDPFVLKVLDDQAKGVNWEMPAGRTQRLPYSAGSPFGPFNAMAGLFHTAPTMQEARDAFVNSMVHMGLPAEQAGAAFDHRYNSGQPTAFGNVQGLIYGNPNSPPTLSQAIQGNAPGVAPALPTPPVQPRPWYAFPMGIGG